MPRLINGPPTNFHVVKIVTEQRFVSLEYISTKHFPTAGFRIHFQNRFKFHHCNHDI